MGRNNLVTYGLGPQIIKLRGGLPQPFSHDLWTIARRDRLAPTAAAADFSVTQVVDRTTGVHGLIRTSDLLRPPAAARADEPAGSVAPRRLSLVHGHLVARPRRYRRRGRVDRLRDHPTPRRHRLADRQHAE